MGGQKESGRLTQRGIAQRAFDDIAEQIDSGELKPGDRLPTYPVIKSKYKVSHVTAMHIVRMLKDALYIRTTTQGIYVNLSGRDRLLQHLCDALNALENAGEGPVLYAQDGVNSILTSQGGVRQNGETLQWERISP